MSIYPILSSSFLINFVGFNIPVLIGTKGGVNYFCDGADEALFRP